MKKAIFCDFYGTLVHENGPISLEVVGRVAESCGAAPEDVVAFWWERFGALSARCCGVDFRTRYDIAVESFQETVERFGSPEDPRALTDRMVEHWCAPPLYEDARAFLEAAPAPVYLVTNSDDHFVEEALRRYGLPVAGAVTSQAARYAKPRPEIFRFALVWPSSRGDRPPGGLAGRGCGDAPRSGYPGPLAQPEGEAGPSGCGGCGEPGGGGADTGPPVLTPNCYQIVLDKERLQLYPIDIGYNCNLFSCQRVFAWRRGFPNL